MTAIPVAERHDGRGFGWRARGMHTYLMRAFSKPFMLSLSTVLVALLLERVLRLLDLLAQKASRVDLVVGMAANLVPHYIGLALPLAFFVSLLLVTRRLSETSELETMEAAGLSLPQIARPFLVLGVILAVFSILLFGFLQPYSRYAYRAIKHNLLASAWDAKVTEGVFINAGDGMVISVLGTDSSGRRLENVFVYRKAVDGDTVLTGVSGEVRVAEGGGALKLILQNGTALYSNRTIADRIIDFESLALARNFASDSELFRTRGDDERELTLGELWHEARAPLPMVPRSALETEFHGRIVRALVLIFIPMLAVPLGLTSKRTQRWAPMAFGCLALIGLQQALELAGGLAENGRINAALGQWLAFAVFAGLCVYAHLRTTSLMYGPPFARLLVGIGALANLFGRCARALARRRASEDTA